MSPELEISVDEAKQMIAALQELHDSLGRFVADAGSLPSPDSRAADELASSADRETVNAAIAQADLLAEAAADHAMAFARTVEEPVQTAAPWACTRSALEASALSCWLFDPSITAKERAGRSLAFRFEGVTQERKYAKAKSDSAAAEEAFERIGELEALAIRLGFTRVRSRNGRRTGVAQRMPSVTELTESALGEGLTYRLLSAVAHAHTWALAQASFRRVDTDEGLFLEKSLHPVFVAYLCLKCIAATARPFWLKCRFFGWDSVAIARVLDTAYDSLPDHVVPVRFWVRDHERQPG